MLQKLRRDEQGVALITVILATMALVILLAASLSFATGGQNIAVFDQNWNASLAAAEAGVDDYLYRLNQDGNYWLYSATNPPPDGNGAFAAFVPVPGPANKAKYKYTPDSSTIAVDGVVRIKVTGQVGNSKRTLQVSLRRRNFLDYLYFTDYETVDPDFYTGNPFTPQQAQVECAHHYYDQWTHPQTGNPMTGRHSSCFDIVFIWEDQINGPLHSNDAIKILGKSGQDGPFFNGDTTTSWPDPAGKFWRDASPPNSSPKFATHVPDDVGKYAEPISMPPSNSALRQWADPVTSTGCLYTGPTFIELINNQIRVESPFTKVSNCTSSGTFTPAVDFSGVIYVQNVPALPTNPNYTDTSNCPSGSFPYPLKASEGIPDDADITSYPCSAGDVFVKGTLDGRLTIGAENSIKVMTQGVHYATPPPAGDDMLGLIADNYVEVYHPLRCAYVHPVCEILPAQDVDIDAAILGVKHSFRLSIWYLGSPRGTLNVTGAIAQRYRGPIGTLCIEVKSNCPAPVPRIKTGYLKNYVYDNRLKYLSPPHFIDPVKSAWGIATWQENPGDSV